MVRTGKRERDGAPTAGERKGEKLARLEVEKAAVMRHKPEQKFDINRARSFMPSFDENAVDIIFEIFEKVATESEWPEEKWLGSAAKTRSCV